MRLGRSCPTVSVGTAPAKAITRPSSGAQDRIVPRRLLFRFIGHRDDPRVDRSSWRGMFGPSVGADPTDRPVGSGRQVAGLQAAPRMACKGAAPGDWGPRSEQQVAGACSRHPPRSRWEGSGRCALDGETPSNLRSAPTATRWIRTPMTRCRLRTPVFQDHASGLVVTADHQGTPGSSTLNPC